MIVICLPTVIISFSFEDVFIGIWLRHAQDVVDGVGGVPQRVVGVPPWQAGGEGAGAGTVIPAYFFHFFSSFVSYNPEKKTFL